MSSREKKHVPQRLRGTARHAKSFKTSTVTASEMLRSQPLSRKLQAIIFAPILLVYFRKMGYVLLMGTKPLSRPPGDMLGAERHCKTCKEFQDQQCHPFQDVVFITLIPRASKCHFCPISTHFLQRYEPWNFPLGTQPFRLPPVSCRENKAIPRRLRGTAPHANSFKTNSGSTSETLSSQH